VEGPLRREEAHRLARDQGVNPALYRIVRGVAVPFMRVYFRLHIEGAQHVPGSGAAIIAPNHKSFWDTFFLAATTPRHLRYMGKVELFEGRLARTFVRLGAFPVRRGEADAEALETARTILQQGGLLAVFPEGTRIRDPEELGSPRRGAGRLALETHSPLIPAAITGTERLFFGPIPKPRRVQVAISEPIPVSELEATPEAAEELIEEQLWPEVRREHRRLRRRQGAIVAGLVALGLAAIASRSRRRRIAAQRRSRPRIALPGRGRRRSSDAARRRSRRR
jgi:1-acyl-sn-glycerol-3-phosphate acyltransferase